MANKLVSIIIPSYNSRQWVCDAIDCSLQQTYPHCEVIVVDDGSTDGTAELLSTNYGDKIRYVYQENRGLSGSRNTGLRNARGDYIQFLDADDLIALDKLEIQVRGLAANHEPSLSYSDYVRCNLHKSNELIAGRTSPVIAHQG